MREKRKILKFKVFASQDTKLRESNLAPELRSAKDFYIDEVNEFFFKIFTLKIETTDIVLSKKRK